MHIKIFIFIVFFIFSINCKANNDKIILASTTSTNDTGLLKFINKKFTNKYNIDVHVLSLGTGQALEVGRRGNADILLVHHAPSEIDFMKNGYGLARLRLMYNEYILIGPKRHQLQCDNLDSILLKIRDSKYHFISRDDGSGTHEKEKELWSNMNLNIENFSNWYKKIGQGMGPALLMANEIEGYTLTDKGTWLKFDKKNNLEEICINGKNPILNQYSIILVKSKNMLKKKNAEKYIEWITSNESKNLINSFKVKNEQLFFYNYKN